MFAASYLNAIYLKVKMDQLLHSNLARLSALVPAGLAFDDAQTEFYGTPEVFDKTFESDEVGENYIKRITTDIIYDVCNFVRDNQKKALKHFEAKTDAIIIKMEMDWEEITLEEICVRPCLQGHKLCTILLYQLYKLARHWDNKLTIQSCTLSMQDTLVRRFGMTVEPDASYEDPTMANCILENAKAMKKQVKASDLGLTDIITERDGKFLVELKPAAFPSAESLRDQEYIDRMFKSALDTQETDSEPDSEPEAPAKQSKKARLVH